MGFVSLPADGRAAGLARTVVRSRLRSWGLDSLLDTAVLLTSEVVANVVIHTTSAPALSLSRDGRGVRVTVVDGSPVPPRRRWHSAKAITGRGLQLLEDLADDWGWDRVGDGKAVWFRLRDSSEDVHGQPPPSQDGASSAASAPSPLGRYATAGGEAGEVSVRLLGVPVRVLAAAREHHDGLMREFRLLALADRPPTHDLPARLGELTQLLGVRFAAAGFRPDQDFEEAIERGADTIDLVYRVTPAVADAARQLEILMREADDFCRSAELITLPRTPLLVRFANWYLSQVLNQIAGGAPIRWDGPLDPD